MAPNERGLTRRTALRTTATALGTIGVAGLASAGEFSVVTGTAHDISFHSANVQGSVQDMGGASSADVHYEWRQEGATTWNTTRSETVTGSETVDIEVENLAQSTTYEFRAVANASDGASDVGGISYFSTDVDDDVEMSNAYPSFYPQELTATSAQFGGWVDDNGGAEVVHAHFEYGVAGGSLPTTSDSVEITPDEFSTFEPGFYEVTVTGLQPDTTYEYRAAGDASDGDSAVADSTVTFTTPSG